MLKIFFVKLGAFAYSLLWLLLRRWYTSPSATIRIVYAYLFQIAESAEKLKELKDTNVKGGLEKTLLEYYLQKYIFSYPSESLIF